MVTPLLMADKKMHVNQIWKTLQKSSASSGRVAYEWNWKDLVPIHATTLTNSNKSAALSTEAHSHAHLQTAQGPGITRHRTLTEPTRNQILTETTTFAEEIAPSIDSEFGDASDGLNMLQFSDGDSGVLESRSEEAFINRQVNCLTDPSGLNRLAAIQSLGKLLLDKKDAADSHALCLCIEESVGKALLRRFSDSSQKCREASISLFTRFVKTVPEAMASLLPYVFPVVLERLPLKVTDVCMKVEKKGVYIEPSEEARFLLVHLIHTLLKETANLIHPFISDIVSVLMAVTNDSCPEVLVEVFNCIEFLGSIIRENLKPVLKDFISAIMPSLCHNRSRVRVAAIHSIHRLVLCGGHESIYTLTAYCDPNLIPIRAFYHPETKTQYFALLASDRSTAVREEFLKTVASWLVNLSERMEHEFRLIPYVLSAFNDKANTIQELAFELMESIGQQYEKENENEVKDIKQYLPEDIDTVKCPYLHPPFKHRPGLGARIMVKRSFRILLHAISADLQAWQEEPKFLAVRLLYVIILYMEENITMHIQSLIRTIIRAWGTPTLDEKIAACAELLGFFVKPASYLEILLPQVIEEINNESTLQIPGKMLKTLCFLMKGSHSLSDIKKHIPVILSVLTEQSLMASIQQEVHESVLGVAEIMVKSWDHSCKDEVLSALWLLLNVGAIAEYARRSTHKVESVMSNLSKQSGYGSTSDLIVNYMNELLNLLSKPQFWSFQPYDCLIFSRLLEEGGFTEAETMDRLLVMTMESLQHAEKNQQMKSRFMIALKRMMIKSETPRNNANSLVEFILVSCLNEEGELVLEALCLLHEMLSNSWILTITSSSQILNTLKVLSMNQTDIPTQGETNGGSSKDLLQDLIRKLRESSLKVIQK